MAALELPRALFIITYELLINIVGECLSVPRVFYSIIIRDFCITWAETLIWVVSGTTVVKVLYLCSKVWITSLR